MFHILVVEDDKNLRRLIEAALKQHGYQVTCASNGQEALDRLDSVYADLIISDVMMPQMDGFSMTRELRDAGFSIPVLMVTARESYDDIKAGFVAGADDYMVKPINIDEMVLRVGAILRRSGISSNQKINIGEAELDYRALAINRGEFCLILPKKEFHLLFKLLSYPKQIFTRTQLMEEIWGPDTETDERTIDVHIKRLRQKLKNVQEFEIITVRGVGYKAEIKE